MAQAKMENNTTSYNIVMRSVLAGREWQLALVVVSTMAQAKMETNTV